MQIVTRSMLSKTLQHSSAPTVTVLALCYNHSKFLEECLESIWSQTYDDFELIVSDDGSRDDSVIRIERWLARFFPTARFIRHEVNHGLCPTLCELITLARGRYIAMIGTDDAWLPNHLSTLYNAMEAEPDAAVAFGDAWQVNETGELLPDRFIAAHGHRHRVPSGDVFPALADANFIPAMAAMIRRTALDSVGGYDPTLSYEDYDMWLRLSARFPFIYVEQPLAKYRIVSTSIVRTSFARPTPAHLRTNFIIAHRQLHSGRLTDAQLQRWSERRRDAAYQYSLTDAEDAWIPLWQTAVAERNLRNGAIAILGSLGLSRTRLSSMRQQFIDRFGGSRSR